MIFAAGFFSFGYKSVKIKVELVNRATNPSIDLQKREGFTNDTGKSDRKRPFIKIDQ